MGTPVRQLTIVAQQELVVAGAEHAHWATALASLRQFLETRVIALRDSDTLEAKQSLSKGSTLVYS